MDARDNILKYMMSTYRRRAIGLVPRYSSIFTNVSYSCVISTNGRLKINIVLHPNPHNVTDFTDFFSKLVPKCIRFTCDFLKFVYLNVEIPRVIPTLINSNYARMLGDWLLQLDRLNVSFLNWINQYISWIGIIRCRYSSYLIRIVLLEAVAISFNM